MQITGKELEVRVRGGKGRAETIEMAKMRKIGNEKGKKEKCRKDLSESMARNDGLRREKEKRMQTRKMWKFPTRTTHLPLTGDRYPRKETSEPTGSEGGSEAMKSHSPFLSHSIIR